MTKQLIERLRADRFQFNGDLDLEAADALEAQQKRIDELETQVDQLQWENKGIAEWREIALAAQAKSKVLREAVSGVVNHDLNYYARCYKALATKSDTTALRELLKAERERCAVTCDRKKKEFAEALKDMADESLGAGQCAESIRAMEDQW